MEYTTNLPRFATEGPLVGVEPEIIATFKVLANMM